MVTRAGKIPVQFMSRAFCLGVLCIVPAFLAGCMTSLAVLNLPDRAKLDPQPDRYFRVQMDVLLAGQQRKIVHTWSCTNEKTFSVNVGWTLIWRRAEGRRYVVKALADDLVIFFREPEERLCYLDAPAPYIADIGVIPNPSTLDEVIVFHAKRFPRSSVVVSGTVEPLPGDPNARSPSLEELDLEARLRTQENRFVSVSVTITPESVWSRYPKRASYFRSLDNVTIAPRPTSPNQPYGFPAALEAPLTETDMQMRRYYTLRDVEGTIKFNSSMAPAQWETFRLDGRDRQRATTFCYDERCVRLNGGYNEIYDPESRNLIAVWQSSTLRNGID